jgi:anti-sigma factor RsiW
MPCAESTRAAAYFDGELDALSAAEFEQHLEQCVACRATLEGLEQMRAALRREAPPIRVPPELRARLAAALDREGRPARRRPGGFWMGVLGGFVTAAAAAGAAFMVLMPPAADAVLDDMMNAHVRSLMPGQLIAVESTDRHTVKPWFAGRADVSPVVADFVNDGYRLLGGRADYFQHQRAAAVVYQHGAHLINVFSWAAGPAAVPGEAQRNGYHFVCWREQDLGYCAVSDAGFSELKTLEGLLQNASAQALAR